MNHSIRSTAALVLFAVVGTGAALVGAGRQEGADSPAVAFVGVHIVPMDTERVLDNQTIIVRDGRIIAMGPTSAVTVPTTARVIEGAGKYLMPGLADMHAHLPPFPGDPGDAADIQMQLYLANGVTTVRGLMGPPAHLTLRDRIARGERMGPSIVAGSPPVHGKNATDAAAAEKIVTDLGAQGFDLVKVWKGLSPDTSSAIATTAARLGLPIAGHVTATVGLDRALAARQSSIEHLDGYLQALVPSDAPVATAGAAGVRAGSEAHRRVAHEVSRAGDQSSGRLQHSDADAVRHCRLGGPGRSTGGSSPPARRSSISVATRIGS